MEIGFIGLGTMGIGMVNNLKKEFNVTVYNRTRSKAEEIEGINIADQPKDLDSTDVIFVCVTNDKALEEVFFGETGLLKGDVEGKIIVDCSTTSIEMTEKLKEETEKCGAKFVDAPITGSKLGAENGTMMFMVGAQKEDFDKILPSLKAMGKRFVYCGTTPSGQKAKHALNLTMSLTLQSYLEGLTLGIANGVPFEAMDEILQNSGAGSNMSKLKIPYLEKRDFEQHFMLNLMVKDLGLAEDDISKLGLKLPLSSKIKEIFEESMDRPDEDILTIAKTLEKNNDIKFS